jgi:hypothetical protein
MAEKKNVPAQRYSREELLANAEALFSVKPEVLSGALHDEVRNEWTIHEARKRIDQFLKRKVN